MSEISQLTAKTAAETATGDLFEVERASTFSGKITRAELALAIADELVFALLAGQSGGQTLNGGTASGDDLDLRSTSNATKGHFIFDSVLYAGSTEPADFTAAADTDGNDFHFKGQSGGAHSANNPDGADFVIEPGAKGSGGAGADGKVIVRQPGGIPGTDEGHIYHDGSELKIVNLDDRIQLEANGIILSVGVPGASVTVNGGFNAQTGAVQGFAGLLTGSVVQIAITKAATQVFAFADASLTNGATHSFLANSQAQFTGDQTDLALTVKSKFQRWSSDASRNVYSLHAGVDGEEYKIHNIGAQPIVLIHDDASTGTAAKRFHFPGGLDLTLTADESAKITYDATTQRWRLDSTTGALA